MARFTPTDPKDLSQVFPDGTYDFEIISGTEGIGQSSGQPYLKLKLQIFHGEKKQVIEDYVSFGPKSHKKLWGFCQATGLEQAYRDGEINPYVVEGKAGKLQLTSKQDEGYEPKNVVAYYRRREEASKIKNVAIAPVPTLPDDDIPF